MCPTQAAHNASITQAHTAPHTPRPLQKMLHPKQVISGKTKEATSKTQSVISTALSTECFCQRQSCPSVVDCHKVLPVAANIHAPAAAVAATKATAATASTSLFQDGVLRCSQRPSQGRGTVRVHTHAATVQACPFPHPATPLPQPSPCSRCSAARLRYQISSTTSSS